MSTRREIRGHQGDTPTGSIPRVLTRGTTDWEVRSWVDLRVDRPVTTFKTSRKIKNQE